MSRTLIFAPGVLFQEQDVSQYILELSSNIFGIVTLASMGVLNSATLCTSLDQIVNEFGIPTEAYPGLLVARDIFAVGGAPVYIVRVAKNPVAATATITLIDSTTRTISTLTPGSGYNGDYAKVSYGGQAPMTPLSASTTFATGSHSYPFTATQLPLVPGTLVISFASTQVATDVPGASNTGTFDFISGYTAYSGTVNYLTGVISIATTSLGVANSTTVNIAANYSTTFTIQFYEVVNGQPYQLETYPGSTPASIITSIENASTNFITDTDVAWDAFPTAGNYFFTGGDDGASGITDVDYIGTQAPTVTGLQQFAYQDQLDLNIVMIPEASQTAGVRQAMINLVESSRNDAICIIDPPQNIDVQTVCDWVNGQGAYSSYNSLDSTYGAAYYPYFSSLNPNTGETELTPPSSAAAQALVRGGTWQAPAGPSNGMVSNIVGIERNLNDEDRYILGNNRINPVSNYKNLGEMVMGQYTLTTTSSSLNRVAARLALCQIEKSVVTAMYPLLFFPLIASTFNEANMIVNPYLTTLVQQGKLLSGTFNCNNTTNTSDTINQNMMCATCILILMKFAEIILVTFEITKLGGSVTETVINTPQSSA